MRNFYHKMQIEHYVKSALITQAVVHAAKSDTTRGEFCFRMAVGRSPGALMCENRKIRMASIAGR